MAQAEDWGRVAEAVKTRRAELGIRNQADAASMASVGVTTWREIEGAKRDGYTKAVEVLVARFLGWPTDMLRRIAGGEDPPEVDQAMGERVSSIEGRLGAVEEKVDQIFAHLEGPAPP